MKHTQNILTYILFTLAIIGCKPDVTVNEAQLFNNDWKFNRIENGTGDDLSAKDLDDADWQSVTLPHTAKVEPLLVNDQWQGICWYRKQFTAPETRDDEKVYLRFEGAMNYAQVWINGVKVGEHLGGYLPFSIDLTHHLVYDSLNLLAVRLDNRDNPISGPKPLEILDFNMYGGIYRNVWLEVKNAVHITDPVMANITAGGGIFITYPEVNNDQAVINIKTHVANTSDKDKNVSLIHKIMDGNEVLLTKETSGAPVAANSDAHIMEELKLANPKLWSPKAPNLYNILTEVIVNGQVVDKQTTRIGVRRFEFIANELYLNGEKMFLRGVNRHQEYPFVGYALSDNAQYRDAVKIKNAGFDYIRLSHYPHSESFMNACDEIGLVVLDAILGWQYFNEDTAFQNHVVQTARDMIRRDRNHASVLAWEVSLNESDQPNEFIDKLVAAAHEEYPGDQCYAAGWQEHGYDIYLQARQHRLGHYKEDQPKPYIVSEYGDWEYYALNAGFKQDAWENMLPDERSSRQLRGAGEARLLQQALNNQEAHNDNFNTSAFADGYWAMFDYNRGYADDLEASGVMDIFRIPKYNYYFFQSQRDAEDTSHLFDGGPMVFIANEWTENSTTDIRIFSNCDEVELSLNDSIIARQKPDSNSISNNLAHAPFTFRIGAFEAGKLEATGFIGNEEVARHAVQTPLLPVRLVMEYDESQRRIEAGCNDVFFVYIKKVDENGTVVPESKGVANVEITGECKLVNPEKITFEAGIATAVLMAGDKRGTINVTATSEGLENAQLNIEIH